MICQHCQQMIPDDSRFCPFCGEATKVEPVQKAVEVQKPKKEKRPISRKKIILFSVLGVVVALLGVYFGTYFAARSKAQAGEYAAAGKLLLVPSVTRFHDPQLEPYIQAGLLYDQGDYKRAERAFDILAQDNYLRAVEMKKYSTFFWGLERIDGRDIMGYRDIEALAKDGFPIAVEKIPDIKDQVYKKGIELYRKKDYAARNYFNAIDPYLRSSDYLTLLKWPEYNSLIKLIGFEDTNKILLNTYAEEFLTGTWKTSDGKYSFSIDEKGYSNYTLPYLEMSNSYYNIEDGIYYLYKKDDHDYDRPTRKNVFRFSIVDADTITVYCYKDGSTHKLYRQ